MEKKYATIGIHMVTKKAAEKLAHELSLKEGKNISVSSIVNQAVQAFIKTKKATL